MSSRHNLDIYGMNACCEFDKISCNICLALRTFVIFVNLDLEISLVCQTKAELKEGRVERNKEQVTVEQGGKLVFAVSC